MLRTTTAYIFSIIDVCNVLQKWGIIVVFILCPSQDNSVYIVDICSFLRSYKAEVFWPFWIENVLRATKVWPVFDPHIKYQKYSRYRMYRLWFPNMLHTTTPCPFPHPNLPTYFFWYIFIVESGSLPLNACNFQITTSARHSKKILLLTNKMCLLTKITQKTHSVVFEAMVCHVKNIAKPNLPDKCTSKSQKLRCGFGSVRRASQPKEWRKWCWNCPAYLELFVLVWFVLQYKTPDSVAKHCILTKKNSSITKEFSAVFRH